MSILLISLGRSHYGYWASWVPLLSLPLGLFGFTELRLILQPLVCPLLCEVHQAGTQMQISPKYNILLLLGIGPVKKDAIVANVQQQLLSRH